MNRYNSKTKDITITALLIAIVFVSTSFINVPSPMPGAKGGLIHLGTVALFIIAVLFGKKKGAIAGGVGMAFFDVFSGYWASWAIPTLIIRAAMGFIVGYFAEIGIKSDKKMLWNVVGMTLGGLWMMIGYYFAEVILYGNWVSPFVNSMLGDLTQNILGFLIGIPFLLAVYRMDLLKNFNQYESEKTIDS